jgi:hypothetical protein
VVISIDTAALAASQRRRPLATCLDELVVHGILHLLGYDHEVSVAEERRMARKAREVRTAIGPLAAPLPAAGVRGPRPLARRGAASRAPRSTRRARS